MKRTLIIAAVVIFALGAGTAGAARLITSRDIRNGTIKTVDLSAKAKRSLRGQVGPEGPVGPQGPAGPSVVGQSGLVTSAQVPFGPTDLVMAAIAFCPAGQRVVSGGGVSISDEQLAASRPTDDRSGWGVIGVDLTDNGGEYVQAYAICAPAGRAVAASVTSRAETRERFARLAARIAKQRRD